MKRRGWIGVLLTLGACGVIAGFLWRDARETNPTPAPRPSIVSRPAPTPNLPAPEPPGPLQFRDVAAEAGLTIPHFDAADGRFRLVETMGSGVGLLDFDEDGWLDVYLAQGALIPADPSDTKHAAQLYRNNRNGTFREVAREAGVAFRGFGQGVASGDFDRDGHEDLYISGFLSAALYRNRGDGTFEDVTERAGLAGHGWATSCAFADLDADGDLDLFVVRYLAGTVDAEGKPTVNCNALPGQIGYCPPLAFAPEPDSLYRNNGDGTFTDVGRESGTSASDDGNGLGLAIADFDDDGRLDIYVANDKTPHRLYRNLGGLSFEEVGLPWGVAFNEAGEPTAGMGVAAGDHDGDDRTDLLVTNFYEEGATLYRNVAPGHFEVATARARLRVPTRSKLGFGTGFFDADNDGWLDLFIANGHVNDVRPLGMPYAMTPQVFRNEGVGRFKDLSASAGDYFRKAWLGRGVAFGDLDNDGDTDVVVSHNSGVPALLRNETEPKGHALRFSLEGDVKGRPGLRDRFPVGARVVVTVGTRKIVREAVAGTSYLSRHDPRWLIGLGEASRADRIEVRWPSGQTQVWENIPADTPLILEEGRADVRERADPQMTQTEGDARIRKKQTGR